jgi:hypothetical protein
MDRVTVPIGPWHGYNESKNLGARPENWKLTIGSDLLMLLNAEL